MINMRNNLLFFSFLFSFFILVSTSSFAASLGVTPASLNITLESGQRVSDYILITNIGNTPQRYLLFTDEEFKSWVSFSDDDIILDQKKSQKIKIDFRVPPSASSNSETLDIYIRSQPPALKKTFDVSAGIKIPVKLDISGELTNSRTVSENAAFGVSKGVGSVIIKKEASSILLMISFITLTLVAIVLIILLVKKK